MDLAVSPIVVALNTQSGSQKHAMTPGQLIDALVLELIDATTVKLAVADAILEVKTDLPLVPGSHVRLAARGHGEHLHWVIVGPASAPLARGQELARGDVRPSPHPASPAAAGGTLGANEPGVPAGTAVPEKAVRAEQRPPPPVADPAVDLANATRSAAARQNGLAPLFADLRSAAHGRDVPLPVKQIATQILAAAVSLEGASGDDLRQAVSRSGLFLEARLARSAGAAPTIVPGDLKAALLSLRHALRGWLDTIPPAPMPGSSVAASGASVSAPLPQQATAAHKPPPPYRGSPTAAQPPALAGLGPDAVPAEVARILLTETEGALARQTLMQAASLTDATGQMSRADGADRHWNLEIPFVTPQGVAVAHFEVQRDGNRGTPKHETRRPWRVNFSLDFEPLGPVHAQLSLTGARTAVNIWAERGETAAVLRSGVAELSVALQAAALDAGDVVVREGAPPRPLKANPGRFLDRAS